METAQTNAKQALFAREVLPHLDVMYGVAFRLTGNARDAEDLVQDAMLRAYRFFDRFEQGSNVRAWLLKLMTNIFLNRVKKSSTHPQMVEFETVEDFLGEVDDAASGTPSSSVLFNDLLDQDVARALDELPAEYRAPILLSAIDGLSYREIAEAMDAPLGTIMSRLYRGRKMLERSLAEYARAHGVGRGDRGDRGDRGGRDEAKGRGVR